MKSKNSSIEMTKLHPSASDQSFPSISSSLNNGSTVSSKSSSSVEMGRERVSDWYDTDGHKTFMRTVRDGDIVELRNNRVSHFGIATRVKQSGSPNGKPLPDEVMIYHLIHSPNSRGQIGQFTIEEFWTSDSRIRINNTTNGMSLYGNSQPISRDDVLKNAFTAHMSTSLKWQTCSDFIRWSCQDNGHDLNHSTPTSTKAKSTKSMPKSSSSASVTS